MAHPMLVVTKSTPKHRRGKLLGSQGSILTRARPWQRAGLCPATPAFLFSLFFCFSLLNKTLWVWGKMRVGLEVPFCCIPTKWGKGMEEGKGHWVVNEKHPTWRISKRVLCQGSVLGTNSGISLPRTVAWVWDHQRSALVSSLPRTCCLRPKLWPEFDPMVARRILWGPPFWVT